MNAADCRQLSERVKVLLAPALPEYTTRVTNGTYDGSGATLRIEFLVPDGGRKRWEATCEMLDLKPEHYDALIVSPRGDEYRLKEIKPGRYKWPLVGARVGDGKLYKLALTPDVRAQLAACVS